MNPPTAFLFVFAILGPVFLNGMGREPASVQMEVPMDGKEGKTGSETPSAADPSVVSDEFISLEDIEPGDPGVWKTAVSGTTVETFPLEVVGILDSFVGPEMPIILCRATDAENTLTGPVSGMSGSPVYIKGRLAGAYAYGFPWSKEKTLIGVTPIEFMTPLLDYPDRPYRDSFGPSDPPPSKIAGLGLPSGFNFIQTSGPASSPEALPIPLLAGGVSANVLQAIQPWLEERELRITSGTAGGSSAEEVSTETSFAAGAPLAVVLTSGDLSLGGVGTITYREGDRLVAFGHPMMGAGAVELPIGGAEVVDVVSSYSISFKLSNIGPVSGTLWQDSNPGVQGQIGPIPYMIPITVTSDNGIHSPVEGKIAEHRTFAPTGALIYAAQTLLTSKDSPENGTVYGNIQLKIEGENEALNLTRRGTGSSGAMDILFSFAMMVDSVLNGSQEFPRIEEIAIDFTSKETELRQILHSTRLDSARIEPGDSVGLSVFTRSRDGELVRHPIEIPLPDGPAGTNYSLFIADADALRAFDGLASYNPTQNLDDLLTELRQIRDNGSIYVQLLRPNPGLRLEGRNLEELPPSVLRLYQSNLETPGDNFLKESVIWETEIPLPGVFEGSTRIEFQTVN
ncbi:MAG: hypothetical protein AAGJ81_09880 [Verrucomicrobiota bacterium]